MPPWSDIDTIMFDMDGTLLDLHFDSYFWQVLVPKSYCEVHGGSEEDARKIILANYADVYGTLEWYCLDYWQEKLQLDIKALKVSIKHKIKIRPKVEALLKILQSSEKRVLLVTNAHPHSMDLKLEQTGIGGYFDRCISSHSLNLAKENQGFWQALQQVEAYMPNRTLLFDDSLPVLRQAQREGIKYLYAINKPDSQQPALEPEEFPQIHDFEQIMPIREQLKP